MIELAKFIKFSRIELGISQIEFARKLKVHPTLVSKWEKGDRKPTIDELRMIYELFNIDFSPILFPKKENKEKEKIYDLEKRIVDLEQKMAQVKT